MMYRTAILLLLLPGLLVSCDSPVDFVHDHPGDPRNPAFRPGTPGALQIRFQSDEEIVVSWPDAHSNILQVQMERRVDGGPFNVVGTAPASPAEFIDQLALEPGMKVQYRARLFVDERFGEPIVSESITYEFDPVQQLTIYPTADRDVVLRWNEEPAFAERIVVERSIDHGLTSEPIGHAVAGQKFFIDTPPDTAAIYTYRLRAWTPRYQSDAVMIAVRNRPGFREELLVPVPYVGWLTLSSNGRFMAVASEFSSRIEVRNAETGTLLRTITLPPHDQSRAAVSNDGGTLVVWNPHRLAIWDVDRGILRHAATSEDYHWQDVIISPDNMHLIIGRFGKSNVVSVMRLSDFKTDHVLPIAKSWALALSEDGILLASSHLNNIEVWDLEARRRIQSVKGGQCVATNLDISARHRRVAASHNATCASPDWQADPNTIFVWDIDTGERLFASDHHADRAFGLVLDWSHFLLGASAVRAFYLASLSSRNVSAGPPTTRLNVVASIANQGRTVGFLDDGIRVGSIERNWFAD